MTAPVLEFAATGAHSIRLAWRDATRPSPLAPRRLRRFSHAMTTESVPRDLQLATDVRAVAEGRDLEAFRRLFGHFAPRVKAYLRRLGAGDEAAEDLMQEVLLTVWRRAQQFDPTKATLSTWVFTIARNKRIDALRRERRTEVELDDPSMEPEPAPRGDRTAERQEMSRRVKQAVAGLPVEQGRLLEIFYFEDKTHSTIAQELGIPLGTVKSRLRLAIGKLRTILEGADE